MSSVIQKNGSFVIKKDEMLITEGGKPTAISLLLQGKLDVHITPSSKKHPQTVRDLKHSSYRLYDLDQNIFIGVNDILCGYKSNLSIAAAADSSLFSYAAESEQDTWDVIFKQKDYGAYAINSLCALIQYSNTALEKAWSYSQSIRAVYENLGAFCLAIRQQHNFEAIPGDFFESGSLRISDLRDSGVVIPAHFTKPFIETILNGSSGIFQQESGTTGKITYFQHLSELPPDLRKTFFGSDQYITECHLKDASLCLGQVLAELRQVFHQIEKTIDDLYGEKEDSAYKLLLATAKMLHSKELDYSPALDAASYIYEKLREVSAYIESEYNHITGIDFEYFEHTHSNSLAAYESSKAGDEQNLYVFEDFSDSQNLPDELKDSAKKILEYSEISNEAATEFMMNLTAFRNLKDKLSAEETARNIRQATSKAFFDIYKAVFKKAYRTKDSSRLIKMFLSFGYMDEKLLYHDQVLSLYKLAGMENTIGYKNIYSMYDWLAKIVEMEKDPSIDQFNMDYFDFFRELKKRGKVTDKDKLAYDNDADGRLSFETSNMFTTNHKLCQGQISTYFPLLHRDMAPRNPARSLVTPALLTEKLNKILETDFSAFHREINYRNPDMGIEKELVMMSVVPDFILMPVYGTRPIMWQEITGRVRSSPGRLLIPVFTDENLDDMLIKLVGNFRWELCRTMMGTAWNDVTQSSITADYTDYIQFYRKNRDLSEEAREKVKAQITKHHSKTRDIFTSDYDLWINNEAKGNPRLNKVARSVLFKHCPFSKPIREQLERQPMYVDMVNVMRNQRAKLVKELESRYGRYIKMNGVLDPVLADNLEFYKNL